jgi:hypothetical protein
VTADHPSARPVRLSANPDRLRGQAGQASAHHPRPSLPLSPGRAV